MVEGAGPGVDATDLMRQLLLRCGQLRHQLEECLRTRRGRARPVLDVPDEMLRGYAILESDELGFTAQALEQHTEFVQLWYRYLNLLRDGVLGEQSPREISNPTEQEQLAIRFIAVASGTAKLILDAGLAGYYTQAYSLVRHLLETWLRLEYIRLRPAEASKWFMNEDGTKNYPPSENTVHNYVVRNAEGNVKRIATQVVKKISDLNKMAHPSEQIFQQTVGVSDEWLKFGANYVPELCVGVLHEGASGLRFILHALDDIAPQSESWNEELRSISEAQREVLEMEKLKLGTEPLSSNADAE